MAGRDDVRLAGGCQCGRVRYELCGAPDHVSVCQKFFISDHRPSLSDRCRQSTICLILRILFASYCF